MRLLLWLWAAWRFLFSGWTTPNTVTTGTPISASDYNTYTRDNLTYLFSQRPEALVVYEAGSNFTTSSTSFVTIDTTNLRITETVNSGRYRVEVTMTVVHSDVSSGAGDELGGTMAFDVIMDGTTRAGGTNGVCKLRQGNNGSAQHTVTYVAQFTELSVGSHTFDPVVLTSGATMKVFNNAYPITVRGVEI